MLWMKCLVLFLTLIDLCMAQSPIIWYPFEVSSYDGTSCVAYDYNNLYCNMRPLFNGYLQNLGTLGSGYDLITLDKIPQLSADTVDMGTAVYYNHTGGM